MTKTGFFYHEDFLLHDTGSGHPERPDRLRHLMAHLSKTDLFSNLVQLDAQPADERRVSLVHPPAYIESVRKTCRSGLHFLDSDTVVCERSYDIALKAAGTALAACDAVLKGEIENAFCAVRPPGHHAEPEKAMGFCLLNNVAVAARYIQNQHDVDRVCILDWDVHHGNGTQNAFYDDPTVLYISIHQHPLYPGTGRADERGSGEAEGTTLNLPSAPGFGDKDYLDLLEGQITPVVEDFKPDFILLSAGFDAHLDDPLANMEVTEHGFAEMTKLLRALARTYCHGKLVSLLEGGYDLNALALSVEAHLRELLV
ncbi:MAG: histone deacetylase [bacterium]